MTTDQPAPAGAAPPEPPLPPAWPEHDKLASVQQGFHAAAAFMRWLNDQGWYLAAPTASGDLDDGDRPAAVVREIARASRVTWNTDPLDKMLLTWLGVDPAELEREKDAMRRWLREVSVR